MILTHLYSHPSIREAGIIIKCFASSGLLETTFVHDCAGCLWLCQELFGSVDVDTVCRSTELVASAWTGSVALTQRSSYSTSTENITAKAPGPTTDSKHGRFETRAVGSALVYCHTCIVEAGVSAERSASSSLLVAA